MIVKRYNQYLKITKDEGCTSYRWSSDIDEAYIFSSMEEATRQLKTCGYLGMSGVVILEKEKEE